MNIATEIAVPRVLRAGLLLIAVLGVLGLATAGSASAANVSYCTNAALGPDTWCTNGNWRKYWDNYNANTYNTPQGSVGVRFIRQSDGAVLYRYFSVGSVYSGYRPHAGTYRAAHAANGATWGYYINGNANFDW